MGARPLIDKPTERERLRKLRSDITASDWAEPEQAEIDGIEVTSDDGADFDSTEEDML